MSIIVNNSNIQQIKYKKALRELKESNTRLEIENEDNKKQIEILKQENANIYYELMMIQ